MTEDRRHASASLGVKGIQIPELTVLWFVVQLMRAKGLLFPRSNISADPPVHDPYHILPIVARRREHPKWGQVPPLSGPTPALPIGVFSSCSVLVADTDFALFLKFPAAALPEANAIITAQVTLEVTHPRVAGLALEAVTHTAQAFRARVTASGGPLPRGAAPASAPVAPASSPTPPFVSAPRSPMAAPAPAGLWAATVQFFSG
ncbi:uncharacterized protein NFIA_055190 [Aspergillus fischeri NRRL 181]|uniref:Uncharacterized protein n=1 Tax=Neosartorya fischeri (strain ATCC 1020 / DSM 3700 / CBS 544.65 / FGSC A1164 / JCM 1740 / NRRL 181 / WB 181) TaxID=331117 RepID=A1DMZ9_NEOFI|nr:uncharacterized protein NFIA_055190 [Aspergillus fischeri NRRL 181]EAW16170.1 hypothetical protein NFIA_055190 [Aspergillus fischeri NRRL 181]